MSTKTDDRVGSYDLSSFPCRRRQARQELASGLVYVDFGVDNGGIVLNLSEDGFSVQAAMPLAKESFSSMRFSGDRDSGSIEVGGRLVWMSDTRKTAGIQFVDLSEGARKRIVGWIALEVSAVRDNQPTTNDGLQATKIAPSGRYLGRSSEQTQPERHRLFSPLGRESQKGQGHSHASKLAHLLPVEASASGGGSSQGGEQRILTGGDAPVANDRSRGALNEVEAIIRSQLFGLQRPNGQRGEPLRQPAPTSGAPVARDAGPEQVPQPEVDPFVSPLAGELRNDWRHSSTNELPHLVPVDAPACESGLSQRRDKRKSTGDGAPVSSDRSRRASDRGAIPRSQFLGVQAPDASQGDSPGARAHRPYLNAVVLIFLSGALTFAAGFALGHVPLDGPSNGASKVAVSELPGAREAVPATTVDNRMVAASADTPGLNPPAADALEPNRASGNGLERSAADPRGRRGEAVARSVLVEPPRSHSTDAAPRVSPGTLLLSAKLYQQRTQPAVQLVKSAVSQLSEPLVPVQGQTVQISDAHVRPEGTPPVQSAESESALSTAGGSAIPSARNVSGTSLSASRTPGTEGRLEESRTVASATRGHADPCRLIHSVQPLYPREAKEKRLEGDVELRVVVGTDGTVRIVKLVSGPPLLASAAMDAARGFRYRPAFLNGQPIEAIQTVTVPFRLKR